MMKNRKKLAGVLATATVLTSAFAPLTVMAEDFDAYNPPVAEVEAGQIKGFMERCCDEMDGKRINNF